LKLAKGRAFQPIALEKNAGGRIEIEIKIKEL